MGKVHRRSASATTLPTEEAVIGTILPALVEALAPDRPDDLRASAAIALGKLCAGRPDAAARIAPHLLSLATNERDREPGYVEESAALALGLMQSHDPVVVFALGDKLLGRRGSARHPRTRAFSAIALGLLRVPASDPVSERVAYAFRGALRAPSASADVPASALLGMGLSGDEGLLPDLLARAAKEGESTDLLRSYAVSAVGRLAGDARAVDGPAVVAILRAALAEGGPHSARSAAMALGRVGRRSDLAPAARLEAVRALTAALTHGDGHAGCLALISLARIGGQADDAALRQRVVRELSGRVTDGSALARPYAALALGLLGRELPDGADDLADLLRRELGRSRGDPVDRGAVALALGLLRDARAAPALLAVLEDRAAVRRLRGYCAVALGMIGDARAREPVRRCLIEERDETLRAELAVAAGLLGDRETVKVLLDLLADDRTGFYVQGCVAVSLGRIGDRRCIEPLVRMLESERSTTTNRVRAAMALGMLGDRLDVPVLSRVSEDANYRAQVEAVSEVLRIL